jgi:multisubunit Na+/H+ antiporter MnhC subunit
MKRGVGSLIWGGLLIILGLLFLVDNLDLLGDWQAPVGSIILGAIALFFLAIYISDRKQWWALIPGLAMLGIAFAVFLAEQNLVEDNVVGSIILAGIALPFLLIFLIDRRHWWALIPAMTMAGVAAGVFLEDVGAISDTAVGGMVVGGISLGFLCIYLVDREQWWALIPGGIMGVVAFFLLVASAARFVWPVAIILLGVLLLRSSLGGGRRRARRPTLPPEPLPSIDVERLDRAVEATQPQRERLPTLEEQIAAAIAEEPETAEGPVAQKPEPIAPQSPIDMPPAPQMPEPPEVPPGPEVG